MAKDPKKNRKGMQVGDGNRKLWLKKLLRLSKDNSDIVDLYNRKIKELDGNLAQVQIEINYYDRLNEKKYKTTDDYKEIIKLSKNNYYSMRHRKLNFEKLRDQLNLLDPKEDTKEIKSILSGKAEKKYEKARAKNVIKLIDIIMETIENNEAEYMKNDQLIASMRKKCYNIRKSDFGDSYFWGELLWKSIKQFKMIEDMHNQYKIIAENIKSYKRIYLKKKLSHAEKHDFSNTLQDVFNFVANDYMREVSETKLRKMIRTLDDRLLRRLEVEELCSFPPQKSSKKTYSVSSDNLNKATISDSENPGSLLRIAKPR